MKTTDLKLFSTFTETRARLFEKNTFYVYYIGAPVPYSNRYINNLAEIPIYIARIDKQTDTFKGMEVLKVDWSSINNFYIGQSIQQNGQFQPIEKVDTTFANSIQTHTFSLPLTNAYQERTIAEFMKDTEGSFFQFLAPIKSIQNELIYTYKNYDRSDIHIPAMECLRHFYVDSISTTLRDNILKADAMVKTNLFREFQEREPRIGFDKEYYLFMDRLTKKDDVHKLFYFLYNENYTIKFNNVWMSWRTKKIIEASIPSKNSLEMKAKVFSNKHGHLVLNIFKSDLLNFDENIFLNYQHPNDYEKKHENNKRDPDQDKHPKVPRPGEKNSVDPKAIPNSQTIDFRAYREEHLYDDDFPVKGLFSESLPMGQQKDRGGKTVSHPIPGGKLTFIPNGSNDGEGILLNLDDDVPPPEVNNDPNEEPEHAPLSGAHDIEEICREIIAKNYCVEGPRSYYFRLPDCSKPEHDENGNLKHCNKAEAYTDVKKKIRRKYTVFKVTSQENSISFFCIDVEPKFTKKKIETEQETQITKKTKLIPKPKHMLILFAENTLEDMIKSTIDDIVFQQVLHGNHLWLKDETLLSGINRFNRVSHTGDAKSMANKILDSIS